MSAPTTQLSSVTPTNSWALHTPAVIVARASHALDFHTVSSLMATTGALLAALVLLLAVGSMPPQPEEFANGATPSLLFVSTIRVFLHHRTPTHRHRRCPPHPCHRPKVDTMDVIKNDFVLVGGDVVSNMNLSQHIAAHVERTLF